MGNHQFPMVDVAVTVIMHGKYFLAVYNRDWGAFTLPMTKRRRYEDPNVEGGIREEEWVHAASRAAAEWTGRTSTSGPKVLLEIAEFRQGDRDGKWKRYHFQVFLLPLDEKPSLVPGAIAEWLTPDDFLNKNRQPISPTARHLIQELKGKCIIDRGEEGNLSEYLLELGRTS